MHQIIKNWQKRNLSLYGKVIIAKTFLLSQISHILNSLFLQEEVLVEIDRIIFKFLWKKKVSNKKAFEKVKRSILCKEVKEGGLGMISIKDQQRVFSIKWLKKLVSEDENSNRLRELGSQYFHTLGGVHYFIECQSHQLDKNQLNKIKSHFWRSVASTWLPQE